MEKQVYDFNCSDNSGYCQHIVVKATSKDEAIRKAFVIAEKNAKGDISPRWSCVRRGSLVRW